MSLIVVGQTFRHVRVSGAAGGRDHAWGRCPVGNLLFIFSVINILIVIIIKR